MNRILIAEDEPHIVRFLVKGLRAQGYTTAHAGDGNQALFMARTGQFDLLLLDLGDENAVHGGVSYGPCPVPRT